MRAEEGTYLAHRQGNPQRIIDRSKTPVLALINIVGNGMRGGRFEQDLADMEAKSTADMALRHTGVVVFGSNRPERPMSELVTKKLRPGDIYRLQTDRRCSLGRDHTRAGEAVGPYLNSLHASTSEPQ